MNKRILCIMAVLCALVLIITPAAAASYTSKLPGIQYLAMKIYTPVTNDKAPNTALLSAVTARNYGSHYNGYIRCFLG